MSDHSIFRSLISVLFCLVVQLPGLRAEDVIWSQRPSGIPIPVPNAEQLGLGPGGPFDERRYLLAAVLVDECFGNAGTVDTITAYFVDDAPINFGTMAGQVRLNFFETGGPLPAANGVSPQSVTTGDFNGDGVTDLATANTSSDNVSILLGNGDGTFAAPQNFAAGNGPNSVTTGDFNGDGVTDLATSNFFTDDVSVLLGAGDGTFAAPQNFAAGAGVTLRSVTTGDFNGDGVTDLATANSGSDNVSVLLGNGDGTFAPPQNFAVGVSPFSVTTGDFNGDGVTDLATANAISDNVSVLLGNGDGTFAAPQNFAAGDGPRSVTTGDFNGDGAADLATANLNSDNVSVLLGNGLGTFAAAQNFAAGNDPLSVTTGDFNGDGVTDLATANSASNNVSVLLGNGDGTFAAAQNFAAGNAPTSVTTGDFNGDGVTDLATANSFSNDVSVLLGNGDGTFAAPQNVATSDDPTQGMILPVTFTQNIAENWIEVRVEDLAGKLPEPIFTEQGLALFIGITPIFEAGNEPFSGLQLCNTQGKGNESQSAYREFEPMSTNGWVFAGDLFGPPPELFATIEIVSVSPLCSPSQPSLVQNIDDTTITPNNSVSCNAGGIHTSNSYYRSFSLAGTTADYTVESVCLGIEVSNGVGAGDVPIDVNFYWNTPIAAIVHDPLGNMTQVDASVSTTIPGDGSVDLTVVEIPICGVTVPDSATDLVVEIFTPGSDGPNPLGQSFFVGSNPNGQSAQTFLAAAACGLTVPTPTAALGFPNMHMVLIVKPGCGGCTTDCTLSCDFPLGDLNGDGVVNLLDVGPFVEALTGGTFICEADINQDGVVNLLDVGPFVAILTGG